MKAVRRPPGSRYFRPIALIALAAASLLLIPGAHAAPPADTPGAPVRLIVALETPTTIAGGPQAAAQAVDAAQDSLARSLPAHGARELARTDTLPLMVVEIDSTQIDALAADPRVAAVELDRLAQPMAGPSMELVGAPAAWQANHTGAGQSIVVLDTGVALTHAALSDAVVGGACFSTYQRFYPPPSDSPLYSSWIDYSSTSLCPSGQQVMQQVGRAAGAACPPTVLGCDHGTHVAALAAGRAYGNESAGVAPGAGIISIQVYSRFSGGACGVVDTQSYCALSWSSDQLKALDWVYANRTQLGVAAVNMSLGDVSPLATPCDAQYEVTKRTIDQLRAAGIPTIAAAGNAGSANTLDPRLSSPACISSVIAVGATDLNDDIALYSNSAPQVALLAPGSDIRSALPGGQYGPKSGTSMATPHVAGAWAVLRAARPEATFAEIFDALSSTGKPITDWRNGVTRARIQLDAAIAALPGPPAVLTISRQRLNYGEQQLGSTSQPQTVTLANSGGTALSYGALNLEGDFARAGGTCAVNSGTIAPGAACTVEITFAPSMPGERHGTLALAGQKNTPSVELLGIGVAPPVPFAHLSVQAVDFGSQPFATTSAPQTVTITNFGGAALAWNGLTVSGDFAHVGGTCPAATGALAPGAACTISLAFSPAALGERSGTLTIDHGATPASTVALSGTGQALIEPRLFLPAVSG
jgi:subtilisin family serine protease